MRGPHRWPAGTALRLPATVQATARGAAMTEKNGARMAGSHSTAPDVVLALVGFAVGGFLAMTLVILLWPGAATAGLLIDSPSAPVAPEEIRHAALMYGATIGVPGAIVPAAGYRVGYTVSALLVVMVGQGPTGRNKTSGRHSSSPSAPGWSSRAASS